MCSQKTEEQSKKLVSDKKITDLSRNAKNLFEKAAGTITKSSALKQLLIGSASGWCTGFLTTRVGKTAALSVGGSVLLIAAANQAGIIKVDWDKIGKKVGDTTSKVETKICQSAPNIKNNVGKYARSNTMFAAGFIGGFLLGLAS